jgi:hypothetical protein
LAYQFYEKGVGVMIGVAGVLILLGLLLCSANERSRRLRKAYRSTPGQEVPAQGSPLAEAITHTVGIAGGIYIAIITTVNFLRLNVPETYTIFGIALDPVASVAFAATILQPFIMTMRDKLFR